MSMVTIEAHQVENEKVELVCVCPLCGKVNKMTVDKREYLEGMERFYAGALVQNAFPNWTVDQREFMLTGNCKCIWG